MQANRFDYLLKGWQQRYGLLAVIWSVLVAGSLAWFIYQEKQSTLRTATAAVLASINKDISFRKWANSHGGVYVPPTEHTPPNPYLKVPDRDVVTTTGKALTLMNPAYVLREMQTDFPDDYGTKSHITSLKLLNPKNAPDAWEAEALRSFEQGTRELMETQQIDGQPYLRLMRPFFIDSGCLKCHEQQGYKLGDIRGGISAAISLKPYLARERELISGMALSLGTIWLLGLAGLGISYRRDRRQADEREKVANELFASEQKYHMVADYTSDWEYWIGVEGKIIYMSPSCKEMTGHDAEEFSGDPGLLLALVHPDDRAAYEAHWHTHSKLAAAGEAEFRIVSKDGETRWINHRCRPVFDQHGNWLGIRAGNRDITERKHIEEEISKLNRSLELRVIERTAGLEAANKDMESFSYSISHDLRAPLRAINGFSKMLQEEYADKLDDEGKRLLNVVGDNAHKMGQLIDDLLAFSRVGRNEIERSVVDMKSLAASVWEELKPDMAGRNVRLELGDIPPAEGDPAMMHQVVFNLLSNAVKFTQHRADARIEVGGQADEHETVYHVTDNGAGFDMQYAPKLFGVFQRLHGMDEFAGTGIGLAIVKRIIIKHGGRVWAEGKIGEGATICFALPAGKNSGNDMIGK